MITSNQQTVACLTKDQTGITIFTIVTCLHFKIGKILVAQQKKAHVHV